MADIFDFYVYDDRSIQFAIAEPIMLEDKDVTQFRFRIPKVLNNIDMTDWEWWFIFVNAKKVKYTTQLTLTDDEDDPDNFSVATYTVGYGFSGYVGSVSFSIEALNVSGEDIVNEWHTRTYNTHVIDTLQGTRAVIPEPEADAGTGLTAEEKSLILELFSKAAYAEDDASTAYDRLEALWTVITRLVSLNLSHVTSSNQSASVENGSRYVTNLTADTNYSINEVTVTMGGVDITSTAYSSGTITIPSVTGNIVITATAVRNPLPSGYTAYDFVQNLQTGNNCAVSTGLDYTYGASNYEHEFDFKLVTGGNTGGIFGLRATTGTTNNSLTAWINGDGTSNLAINAASSDTGYTLTASKTVKNTIKITHASGNTKVYFNESLVIDAVDASFTVSENKYFHLFKAFTASSSSSGSATSKIKVYEYSVKNISTGDYVARMIPCVEDSTSNAGFYDIVRNAFYTSSSTGQLQAGND